MHGEPPKARFVVRLRGPHERMELLKQPLLISKRAGKAARGPTVRADDYPGFVEPTVVF